MSFCVWVCVVMILTKEQIIIIALLRKWILIWHVRIIGQGYTDNRWEVVLDCNNNVY